MVELYRQSYGLPKASLNDLLNHIGTPTSFASTDPNNWLRASDGELAEFLTSPCGKAAQANLESQYPHFAAARLADEQRESPEFTEFDGLVPEAGPSLSPTSSESRVSPSRLETFGTCPRRFFFKYGLGAYPPDEWDIDPEQWLDPIGLGNLIHGLFETFMRELTSENRSPVAKRDLPRLLELLNEHIEDYLQDIPIPNEDAFQRQREWLEECCEIFLEKDEAYCMETGAKPWVLEAAIGLDEDPVSNLDCREPIALGLKNGELIRVGGRIDRVDRLAIDGSESYAIWDYKSGSDWGFSQDDPFQKGRKLQSFLYVSMLRHRLAATGGNKDAATSFGYFFPNAKTQGKRIQWMAGELKQGDQILQNICTMIQQGAFPATTEPKDCKFCDYNAVCSDAQIVTTNSIRITRESRNRETLGLWKELREL
jgi:ATP-dependent helicase/nuclease subunit B